MATLEKTNIYLAIQNASERSHIEDQLVLDGANVSTFSSAQKLWNQFQVQPARMVITDRRFDEDFNGIHLIREIRRHYKLPYVYLLLRSRMGQIDEIKEGLELGVDDYLIFPHNPIQIRSRVLVGFRWLTYIDSITKSGGH